MTDAGWPADPNDPRCPECGEPVSATASYCMHCYVDLPTGDATDDARSATAVDTPTTDYSSGADDTAEADWTSSPSAGVDGSTDDASTGDDAAGDTATATTDTETTDDATDWTGFSTTAEEAADGEAFPTTDGAAAATDARTSRDAGGAGTATGETGLLDPDGVVDNTGTLVVAFVLGTFSAIVASILVAFPLPGSLPFFAGLVVWVGVTGHVARSPTVFEATRRGCYAFAGVLVAAPVLLALAVPMQDGSLVDRVVGLVFAAVFVLPIATVVAAVGFAAGRLDDG